MSRSGYVDGDYNEWAHICWRGAVASALRGARGQAFLKEMLAALDALPEKRLVAFELQKDGEVCAIGAVGAQRGVDMSGIDVENNGEEIAAIFGIAYAMACEIMYENDEAHFGIETPELRFARMRRWIVDKIND